MISEQRLKIENKINYLEKNELWDNEVEDNPETKTLMPDKVDYLNQKFMSKVLMHISNRKAINFYEKEIKNGNFIIKNIYGLDNYKNVNSGAIITCNHFSVYDNYLVYRAIRNLLPKHHYLYKVIREGNYTNFPGLFGLMFRHCNTLPLSSNTKTMLMFMRSVSTLLKNNEKILIYPEQAMWRNYKKPRPTKNGAYKIAALNNVPIIPAFITMEDTEKLDKDGFNLQAYTLWFLPPIYPKKELSLKENTEYMKNENFKVVKELYERVYNIPLKYNSIDMEQKCFTY